MTPHRINYEKELNPPQHEAVTFGSGPLLVIAGAGSGKTRTLTYRVARLVEDGIFPGSILLLTFTRKAAQEMLLRATTLLDERCHGVSGGTFHSFAHLMLRRYGKAVGIDPGFAIIDRGDAESLIGMIRSDAAALSQRRALPKKHTLANIFSKAVNKVLSVEDVLFDDYPHFIPFLDLIIDLHRTYQQRKREHNFVDYDDLLIYFHSLLRDSQDMRENIAGMFRYVMVDEYQDTNLLQAEIVNLIANTDRNVMVVGDDAQSIYAFRGAQFQNIMRFPEFFSDTRIIRLEENYRSVQPVLDFTNRIISRAKEGFKKTLFCRNKEGRLPQLVRTSGDNAQSLYVVERLRSLHGGGIPYHRMAVLFRSGFHSFDLEIELNRNDIAFIKVGGFKFVESAHIKDFLAHIKVLVHPEDRISWYRILLLLDKIGPKTAEMIFKALQKENSGSGGLAAIQTKPAWRGGIEKLSTLFSSITGENLSVSRIGESVFDHYRPLLEKKYDDHPKRKKDLEHLLTIMARYKDLDRFVNDMALEPPNTAADGTLAEQDAQQDRLVLSTIHSAKGLEWDAVFIISALDGRFPSAHAMHREADMEEERRLMYVAATRAREHLAIVYPTNVWDKSTGNILYRPSCLIDDMPDDVLEKISYGGESEWY